MFKIGCHVSAAGGVWNAPKNAADLECETFQIFTRPPMGGPASKIDAEVVEKFKVEMKKYFPPTPTPPSRFARHLPLAGEEAPRKSAGRRGASPPFQGGVSPSGDEVVGAEFVVHAPYIVNFGSAKPSTYHGSVSIVSEELKRANSLGAKLVMTHLGSFKDLGQEKGMVQAKQGFVSVLEKYEGSISGSETSTAKFLLEIAAGSGEVIGDTFEELAELMEPLTKFKTFGGICFDTQHAFSSGYDIRDLKSVTDTFKKFDKVIGLKWLKMSHINDSKIDLGGRKDRHEHIGDGKIGEKGFQAILEVLSKGLKMKDNVSFPLILETEHDKVESDLNILKKLRNKIYV